jgi:ElaB/YqjD/DUF883 family membrane-anchored ribosome-binding protein
MAEETLEKMATKGMAGADNLKIQTAEALEEAARKLRNTEIPVKEEDVRSILHGVQAQVDHYKEEIGAKFHDVEAGYQKSVEPVENVIREHPVPAVLVALGVGFLFGMLMSKSRD